MKRMTAFAMIAAILLPCVKAAEVTENMNFRGQVNFDAPCIWSIQGTKVTQTAAQLNAAGGGTTATITPTTVSNLNANIVGSNLVITTGGTVILPSASIASTALPAAIANSTTFSNLNANIVGSNLVITTGGTVTVPADAISIDAVNGITVSASAINAAGNGTTTTLTPTTVSNLNANIVGSNLVITTGGTVIVPADAISIDAVNGITVSAAAINAAGNGTTATITPTTVSNLNANVVCSNLVVTAGGTVIVPADSVSLDAVNGITASAGEINAAGAGTTATISPTTATVGTTLTASKTFINTPETITLTEGNFTLTPTNAVYCFGGQYGQATVTLASATSSGMYLELINLGATNVVVVDGAANLTTFPASYGAWTNGQYDVMLYRSISTNWINTGTFAGN